MSQPCNGCTLCCKLLSVQLANDEHKPDNSWCRHCAMGGCSIYPERPDGCRTFTCLWASDERMPVNLWPKRSKCVIWTANLDAHHKVTGAPVSVPAVMVGVDAGYPTRYKEQPVAGVIETSLKAGMPVVVLIGKERKLLWPDKLGHLAAGNGRGQTGILSSHGLRVGQLPGTSRAL